jgi:hypothetical protein
MILNVSIVETTYSSVQKLFLFIPNCMQGRAIWNKNNRGSTVEIREDKKIRGLGASPASSRATGGKTDRRVYN